MSAAGNQEDSEEEVDVFVEVEKEKVIKTFSKEKAVNLLFKKRDDGEGVSSDELGLVGAGEELTIVEKPEEKKPKPPPVTSFPPGSLFATAAFAVPSPKVAARRFDKLNPFDPYSTWANTQVRSLLASNSLTDKMGPSTQPNPSSQHSTSESTENTENGEPNRPKKMTFDRMLLRHVSITGQGQNSTDLEDNCAASGPIELDVEPTLAINSGVDKCDAIHRQIDQK